MYLRSRGGSVPKLLILAACEKVIIDRAQVPSLIGIFQGINIQLTGEPMPAKALSQMRWAVFTDWETGPEEIGTEFTQHLEIITPSGEIFVTGMAKFTVTDPSDFHSKVGFDLVSIPVHEEGFFKVRVWLDSDSENRAEYRFYVKHLPQPQVTTV
jgi:hypothetical protein